MRTDVQVFFAIVSPKKKKKKESHLHQWFYCRKVQRLADPTGATQKRIVFYPLYESSSKTFYCYEKWKKWLKFTMRKIKELLSMKFSTILFFVLIYNQMESGPLIRTYCSKKIKKIKKTLKICQLKNNFQRWRDKPPFFFE